MLVLNLKETGACSELVGACSELDTDGALQVQKSLGLLTYHDPKSHPLGSVAKDFVRKRKEKLQNVLLIKKVRVLPLWPRRAKDNMIIVL